MVRYGYDDLCIKRAMGINQAACIAAMKMATVSAIRTEKMAAAQRLRCTHTRSMSRREGVARSAGKLSRSPVGGVRGMNKMRIEINQKGGKTAQKHMTNGPIFG